MAKGKQVSSQWVALEGEKRIYSFGGQRPGYSVSTIRRLAYGCRTSSYPLLLHGWPWYFSLSDKRPQTVSRPRVFPREWQFGVGSAFLKAPQSRDKVFWKVWSIGRFIDKIQKVIHFEQEVEHYKKWGSHIVFSWGS